MNQKLLTTAFISILLFASVIGVSFPMILSSWVNDFQAERVEDQAMSLRQIIEFRNRELSRELVSVIALEEKSKTQPSDILDRSEFLAVFSGKLNQDQFQVSWSRKKEKGFFNKEKEAEATKLLSGLPWGRVQGKQVIWSVIQLKNQVPILALMLRSLDGQNEKLHVGLLPAQTWSEVMGLGKASAFEFMVFDSGGNALAYTQQAYLGANMSDHPIVKKLVRTQEAYLSEAESLKGEPLWVAGFRVSGTNLSLFVANQKKSILGFVGFLVGVLVFGLLASFAFYWGLSRYFIEPFEEAFRYLRKLFIDLAYSRPIEAPNIESPELRGFAEIYNRLKDQVHVQKQENTEIEVFQQMSQGLSEVLVPSLATILGQAQIARSKAQGETFKSHFTVIEREARRTRETLENMLSLGEGQKQERRFKVDVREVILEALAKLKPAILKNDIRVEKDLPEELMILVNPQRVRLAFEEILKNAIESYQSQKSILEEKELRVSAHLVEGRVCVSVTDQGCGISADQLVRVFEPFYTGAPKANEAQSGMGLTLAKTILKRNSGKIEVESDPGLGTTVEVKLPLADLELGMIEEGTSTDFEEPSSELSSTVQRENTDLLGQRAPADLGGLSPLVGSSADDFPAAPMGDEMTFLGEVLEASSQTEISIDELGLSEEMRLDETIQIRAAKVRSES